MPTVRIFVNFFRRRKCVDTDRAQHSVSTVRLVTDRHTATRRLTPPDEIRGRYPTSARVSLSATPALPVPAATESAQRAGNSRAIDRIELEACSGLAGGASPHRSCRAHLTENPTVRPS